MVWKEREKKNGVGAVGDEMEVVVVELGKERKKGGGEREIGNGKLGWWVWWVWLGLLGWWEWWVWIGIGIGVGVGVGFGFEFGLGFGFERMVECHGDREEGLGVGAS